MRTDMWTVAEARAKFSEMIDWAKSGVPQTITRHGRVAAVVVSGEAWECKTKRVGNLTEFFAVSSLVGSDLKLERTNDQPRDIDL